MRFVDREQGQLAGLVQGVDHRQRAVEQQALGGDIDEVDAAIEHLLFDGLRLAPVERRVQAGGLDAELGQGVDLVLHQRNQRRNDDGAAGAEQGGDLVAEALAAAGRQHGDDVAAGQHLLDDAGLQAAELGMAKDPAQGYAPDFVATLQPLMKELKSRGIKVIANAGGVNPSACRAALVAAAQAEGVDLAIAAVLAMGSHPAAAQGTGALTSKIELERLAPATSGQAAAKTYVAPDVVVPGDRIRVTLTFTNNGAAPAAGLNLTNPIPEGLVFDETADAAGFSVSVDGGKTFGALASTPSRLLGFLTSMKASGM
eukprot:gene2156-2809_t